MPIERLWDTIAAKHERCCWQGGTAAVQPCDVHCAVPLVRGAPPPP